MNDLEKQTFKVQNIFLKYGFFILMAVFIIFFSIAAKSFMTVSNLIQVAIVACFLSTVAAGETLVVITGKLDLSVGSVVYLAGAIAYTTSKFSPIVSILLGILVGIIAGLINGLLISYLKMNPLLTTLGILIAYRGISLLITGATNAPVSDGIGHLGKIKIFSIIPLVVLVSWVVMIILQILLTQTKFGAYCYAIGNNESGAIKIGIPVKAVKLLVFIISGTCSAISGILLAMYLGEISTFTGRGMEFNAISAVVIGGTSLFGGKGNILPGTYAGALLLILINNGLGVMGASMYLYAFISGVVIFLAIYLDSLKNLKKAVA